MKRLFLIAGSICVVLFVFEMSARVFNKSSDIVSAGDLGELIESWFSISLSERELDNRFIVQNAYLFKNYKDKESVTDAFIGTSRTKVLKPSLFGKPHTMIGAGNSYNEITYGLLIEAQLLKFYFPRLDTLYVEASMLMRRPAPPRFIVEQDHLKYLPMLRLVMDFRSKYPGYNDFLKFLSKDNGRLSLDMTHSMLFDSRTALHISSLASNLLGNTVVGSVEHSPLFRKVTDNGEYKSNYSKYASEAAIRLQLDAQHPVVARISNVAENAPYDYLFDVLVDWGESNDVKVVLYQPPVRSDLYAYQVKLGLGKHVGNLLDLNEMRKVVFLDLNSSFIQDRLPFNYYSDTNHLATCVGSTFLYKSITYLEEKALRTKNLLPDLSENEFDEIVQFSENFCKY